jgi:hypothetical protein
VNVRVKYPRCGCGLWLYWDWDQLWEDGWFVRNFQLDGDCDDPRLSLFGGVIPGRIVRGGGGLVYLYTYIVGFLYVGVVYYNVEVYSSHVNYRGKGLWALGQCRFSFLSIKFHDLPCFNLEIYLA